MVYLDGESNGTYVETELKRAPLITLARFEEYKRKKGLLKKASEWEEKKLEDVNTSMIRMLETQHKEYSSSGFEN